LLSLVADVALAAVGLIVRSDDQWIHDFIDRDPHQQTIGARQRDPIADTRRISRDADGGRSGPVL
jgi:hypothetical protein